MKYTKISMADKTSAIFKKMEDLEKDLQRLKIEAFFALPEMERKFTYPEMTLRRAIRDLRKTIWKERYARKI